MLWQSISKEPPHDIPLFVDFGHGSYPHGIRLVMKSGWIYWQEDEGQWKEMGSEAEKNAVRWCTANAAMKYLASIDSEPKEEGK